MSMPMLILNNAPISCSLHPLSYPCKLAGSVLFVMQPFVDLFWPEKQNPACLFKEDCVV